MQEYQACKNSREKENLEMSNNEKGNSVVKENLL